ncbi:unnamed protein product, partial [Ectocarpus sp. 12 AP-2014]
TTHLLLERRKGAPPTRTKTTTIRPNGRTDCPTCCSRSHLSIVEARRDFGGLPPHKERTEIIAARAGYRHTSLLYERERERGDGPKGRWETKADGRRRTTTSTPTTTNLTTRRRPTTTRSRSALAYAGARRARAVCSGACTASAEAAVAAG